MSSDDPSGARVLANGGGDTLAGVSGGSGGSAGIISVGSPWLLVRAAAAECGFSDLSATPSDGATRVHPYLAGIAPVVPSWWTNADGTPAFSIFPAAPASCDEVLVQEEALLCVAKMLDEASSTVGPLTWEKAANLPDLPGVPSGPWTIPPPKDDQRFIARDLALHMLANVARTDMQVPSRAAAGESRTCADLYGQAAKDGSFATQNANVLFGVDAGSTPPYFPPDGSPVDAQHATDIASARLLVQAHVLRASGRLLHDLVTTAIDDDVTIATARDSSTEPTKGADTAWGLDVGSGNASYNSLPHAVRVLFGRLEMGPGTPDRACAGLAASQILPGAYGADFTARATALPIATAGQMKATQLVASSGLLVPEQSISSASASALRQALVDELTSNAGTLIGKKPDDPSVASSYQGQVVKQIVAGMSDDDLRFGFQHATMTWRMATGSSDVTPQSALLAAAATNYTPPSVNKLGGFALGSSSSTTSACSDPTTKELRIATAAQCDEYGGADGALNPDLAFSAAYQSSGSLARTLYRRLVRIREASDASIDAHPVADGGAAEMRAWAGGGQVIAEGTGDGTTLSTLTFHIIGVDAGDLPSLDPSDLASRFVLVRGDAWVGECAAHLRTDCPAGFESDYTLAPQAVNVTQPSDDPTIVGKYGTDGAMIVVDFGFGTGAAKLDTTAPVAGAFSLPFYLALKGGAQTSIRSGQVVAAATVHANTTQTGTSGGYSGYGALNDHMGGDWLKVVATCPGGGDSTPGSDAPKPRLSCLGEKKPPYITLDNELTAGSATPFDASWKHYLDDAKQAADRADQIGQKLIDVGLQGDMQREGAAEELGKICGDVAAAGQVSVSGGQVSSGSSTLATCLSEPTYDLVYPSDTVPGLTLQNIYDDLRCDQDGGSDPLCAKLKKAIPANAPLVVTGPGVTPASPVGSDPSAFYVASLGLGPAPTDVGGQASNCSAIGDAAQHLATTGTDLSAAVDSDFARLDSLRQIVQEMKLTRLGASNAWAVTFLGTTVMSSDFASGLWPGCARDDATVACDSAALLFAKLFQEGATSDAPSGGCGSSKVASADGCIRKIGVGAAASADGLGKSDELALLLWRVEGAMWLLGGMTGSVPADMFNVNIPIVNFKATLASYRAPILTVYGDSKFTQNAANPNLWDLEDDAVKPEGVQLFTSACAGGGGVCFNATPQDEPPLYPAWIVTAENDPAEFPLGSMTAGAHTWNWAATEDQNALGAFLKKAKAGIQMLTCAGDAGRPRFAGLSSTWAPALWQTVTAVKVDNNKGTLDASSYDATNATSLTGGSIDFVITYPPTENDSVDPANWPDRATMGGPWATASPDNLGECIDEYQPTVPCGWPEGDLMSANPSAGAPLMKIGAKCVDQTQCPDSHLAMWSTVSAQSRVLAFINSYPPSGACGAGAEVIQALGLACHFATDPIAVDTVNPPQVSDPSGFFVLGAWLGVEAQRAQNAVGHLHLANVPARVVDDFARGLVGTGSTQGEQGQEILQLEQSLQTLYQSWLQIAQDLSLLGEAIKTAQIQVDAALIATDMADAQIAIQILQVHQAQAQAVANAVSAASAFFSGAPQSIAAGSFAEAGALANLAASVYYGGQQIDQLNQMKDLANKDKDDKFADAMNQLNGSTAKLYTDLATALSNVRASTASTMSATEQIRYSRASAAYAAAKASGADFVTVNGEAVPLRVNAVLAHEYDATKQRYDAALKDAKYLSCIARLAIEQRIGARLSGMHDAIGSLPPPSQWADDFKAAGVDYDALACTGADTLDPACMLANTKPPHDAFIGDYTARLQDFVDEYNVRYPFQEGEDTVILSLASDILGKNVTCSRPSVNLLASSSDLSANGWKASGCTPNACLTVAPATKDPTPPAAGTVSLLIDSAPAVPAGGGGQGGTAGSGGFPGSGLGTPVVYQDIILAPGHYILSWWGQSRAADGSLGSTQSTYLVGVYDDAWLPVATQTPMSFVPTGTSSAGALWGPRLQMPVDVSEKGTFHVAFAASLAGSAMASIAISDVQLESAPSNVAVATVYEDTNASRTVVTGTGCRVDAHALQASFDRYCSPNTTQCGYILKKPFVIDFAPLGNPLQAPTGLEAKFGAGKGLSNYRHEAIAVNLVGTGVHDCTNTPSSGCFGSGYEQYTLSHIAPAVWLANPITTSDEFDFGADAIRFGKALAAEKYLTIPLSSTDASLVAQPEISKTELQGRPLDGYYNLSIWDSPSLQWNRLEDVQIVVKYRYWSNTATGSHP